MAGRLTPLGLFVKWVLIPLLIACLGYFLLGPSIGSRMAHPLESTEPQGGPGVEVESKKL